MNNINTSSIRYRKARLRLFGKNTAKYLLLIAFLLAIAGLGLYITADTNSLAAQAVYFIFAMALALLLLAIWYTRDLSYLPPSNGSSLDSILDKNLLAAIKPSDVPLNPRKIWEVATRSSEGNFMCERLLIDPAEFTDAISNDIAMSESIWQTATELNKSSAIGNGVINAGHLMYAIFVNNEPSIKILASKKLKVEDVKNVSDWLDRIIDTINTPEPYFGGLGRDWATGYTPNLERFGENISSYIEAKKGMYHTLAHQDVLDAIVYNLSHNKSNVAIVGDPGTGKTSLVYALAERLLEGRDAELKHYQIVSLNASTILSAARDEIENLVLILLSEAVRAGNIIVFLDEASLFFGSGTGSMDLTNVLLPVLQNQRLKLLISLEPNGFQALRTKNDSFASNFSVINVNQPDKPVVMDVLEDSAITLERTNNVFVSFEAVKEAYQLSGQYMQDLAYPGKAITLLEQSAAYAEGNLIDAGSVAQAIEKTKGVKVGLVGDKEADVLLNLENKIHSRMINQVRAVNVVASALRRTRSGVAAGNRPIGSFLFLGPTGVGKTELAKSLAAEYFGDEQRMIRLDMSEYQQVSDINRLLGDGSEGESLVLAVRKQPFSIVLLDEIEKAHPNILNLLLQMLDEGKLTDIRGKSALFSNSIIICTSNAGSKQIIEKITAGQKLEDFEKPFINELINSNQFKPELLNRFDDIVLFRPLNLDELTQVAKIMLESTNKALADRNIQVELTKEALIKVVKTGYDPVFGARPMRRVIQEMVEDAVSVKILDESVKAGEKIVLDVNDLSEPK